MFSMWKISIQAFVILSVACGVVMADARSSDEQEVSVRANYDRVCDFIEAHADKIIEASHNTIIDRTGDKVKLKNNNNRETIIFTVQEKNKRGEYGSKLIKSHQGGLTEQSTEIIVTKGAKGKVDITIKVLCEIQNPNIGTPALRIEMVKSAKGIKNYLKDNIN